MNQKREVAATKFQSFQICIDVPLVTTLATRNYLSATICYKADGITSVDLMHLALQAMSRLVIVEQNTRLF
ncbi:hypothetical protein DPMN_133247 [Dreissena polymorpha]|uniref:Uncharacterized protein n=1 Tax=Dreissena polymorpha TaxID=45954 RepID=A0A9D4FTW9_DREPO|nr:hypothetical protein DPMN_133247 [Dreissena polymorpha]